MSTHRPHLGFTIGLAAVVLFGSASRASADLLIRGFGGMTAAHCDASTTAAPSANGSGTPEALAGAGIGILGSYLSLEGGMILNGCSGQKPIGYGGLTVFPIQLRRVHAGAGLNYDAVFDSSSSGTQGMQTYLRPEVVVHIVLKEFGPGTPLPNDRSRSTHEAGVLLDIRAGDHRARFVYVTVGLTMHLGPQ